MAYHEQVREFIVKNFLFGDSGKIENSTSLLNAGIIDSTGILEIVQFLEETYKIIVNDDELLPENLDSVDAIAGYLKKKTEVRSQNRE
jgi:acyl carrier protein